MDSDSLKTPKAALRNGTSYFYWLDGNTPRTHTEEIVVSGWGGSVVYHQLDADGHIIHTEILLDFENRNYTD